MDLQWTCNGLAMDLQWTEWLMEDDVHLGSGIESWAPGGYGQTHEGIPQGLKPAILPASKRPKAEALGYLEKFHGSLAPIRINDRCAKGE
jgi:hypothetical protein